MSDTVDFEIEDPVRKWKREADERDAEIAAEREKEQREREQAQRRAQREAAESWDAHINNLIESRDESLLTTIGEFIGEQRAGIEADTRWRLVSFRIWASIDDVSGASLLQLPPSELPSSASTTEAGT